MEMEQRLRDICRSFRIQGSYVESELIPVGNVNKTYKVTYRREEGTLKSYIVQQVNTFVFRKPEQVMHNIDLVTEHIRAKSTEGIPLHFHHTADRKTYIFADDGFWRLYNYIPSVRCSSMPEKPLAVSRKIWRILMQNSFMKRSPISTTRRNG